MTPDKPAAVPVKRRTPVFTYLVAIAMLILGVFGAVRGMPLSLSFLLIAIALTMFVGLGRPLYRAAVYRRSPDEILCRFIPWYQSSHLAASLGFPIIGIATIAQGREPDSPFWVLWLGIIAFVIGVVLALSALLAWVANRLVITPSALSIRIIFRRELNIPRERVQGITGKSERTGATGAPRLHVDLTYSPEDASDTSATIPRLDGQFTVDPVNLVAALQTWKGGDPNDPGLLDLVEKLLRRPATP